MRVSFRHHLATLLRALPRLGALAAFVTFSVIAATASAQQADLVVNQADSPDPGPAGGVFTYTIRVDNNGPDASIGITLTDTLPPGSTFVGAATTQGSCGAPVAGVLTCSLGNLAFLANATVTVQVILPTAGVWTNTASATATTIDPNTANNLNIAEDTTAQNASDMAVTVVDAPDPVTAGAAYNYAVTVRNNGPAAAASQTVTLNVPAGACITATPSGTGWACVPNTGYPQCVAGTTITCTRNTSLASGANAPVLNFPAVANVGGTISTAFTASSPLPDGNLANNTFPVSTTVIGGSNVSITKTASSGTIGVGQNVTYTLTPRLNGGEPAGSTGSGIITVTDTLGAGLTFVGFTQAGGWTCNFSAPTLTCTRPGPFSANFTNMPVITVTATVTAIGTVTNTANIAIPETDPVPANNTATVNVTGSNSADMSISKTVSQSPVVPGFNFTYTLTARNNGPVALAVGQTVTVTDTLPAFINLRAASTGTGWTCTSVPAPPYPIAGATITCTRLLAAAQAANTNFPNITIPVVANSAGNAPNTACVALSGPGPSDGNAANNCGSVATISTDPTVAADLRVVSKTANPNPVLAGQNLTYVITVDNQGPGNATNVVVTDALASLVATGSLQSATPSQGTCVPPGPSNGASITVNCNLGSLLVGASATVTIVVRPSIATTGNRTNTATVNSQDVGDPNRANNTGSVTSVVTAIADVTVAKTATPSPVQAGTPLTYTLTARNTVGPGPSTAANVVVTDTLPANAAFLSLISVSGGGSCITPVADTLGGTLTCTWATIASNAQQTAQFRVRPVTGATSVQNDVVITTTTQESDANNNTATITTPVTNAAVDILVNKVDSVDPVALGQSTTYTVTTTNGGPSFATNVQMVDTFPAPSSTPTATFSYQGGLTINPPGIGTCVEPALNATSGVLTCTFPGLASGQSAVVTYDMRAESISSGISGTTFNRAVVSADEPESLPNNNTTVHATTTRRVADLALVKSAPATVTPGTTFDWTLTVTNNGPNPSTGAVITDTLPAGVAFQSASPGCVEAAGVVTCTLGTVASGGSTSVTINALVSSPYVGANPLLNSGSVATVNEVDPVPGNNTGGSSSALAIADLQVVKAANNAQPVIGGNVIFSVAVTNNGPDSSTGIVVNDLLPAGYVYVTSSATQGSYVSGTGVWTVGSLANGASATLSITATVAAAGPYANTAVVSSPVIDPIPGNNTSTVTPVPLAGPTLVKGITPASIVAGGNSTLTLTLGNPNGIAISLGADFTDTMPAGVTTTSGNTGTCAGVTVTSTNISMASGTTIPPGGCTIIVAITSSTPGTVTNITGSLIATSGTALPASAPLTVTAAAPTHGKTILPATIVSGASATLTLTLANSNAVPLTLSAAYIDTMPAGVTTTSGNTGTCAGATVTSSSITMASGSSIPTGGCTIVVTITSFTPGGVTNTTSDLATSAGTAPPVSAPLTVTAAPPTNGKTILPATVVSGGSATLTLTLANINTVPLTLSAAYIDTMPAGVTTTSGNAGTCTGVTVTPTSITMASGSSIPPGGCTIVVTITSFTPGGVVNTTGDFATNAGTAPPASAPLTINPAPATHAKTILPATIASGGQTALTLTLANINTIPLTLSAAYTDVMPAGVTLVSGSIGTCAGVTTTPTTVTMASGTAIPPGGCTITVRITSSTPGTVTNTTSVLSTNGGVTPPASAPLTVTAAVSGTVKTIVPATINAGGVATLTITLSNANAAPLTLTAPFTDVMPAGMTTTSANSGTCTGVTVTANQVALATGSTIAPGGCTIVVQVTSSTPGTVTNTTSILQTGAGVTPPASAPLTVSPAKATLTKTIAPATISVGGTATLTLTLGNPNALPITLTAAFVDNMPGGVTTTSANSGTCTGVVVTSAQVSMSSGATIPVGGCTVVVTITSSTPGTVVNTTGDVSTSAGLTPGASAPLTVTPLNPGMTKTILPATITSGGTATLTITLGNANPVPVTLAAAFTDTMPAGVTTTSGNTGSCATVTVTPTSVQKATGSTIPPGGCTIVVTVTSSTPGTVVNTTGSLQTNAGVTPPASAPLTVQQASASLSKTIVPATIVVDGTATLTLTLGNTNATPISLTSAFTDTMPAGVTTTSANTGTCSGVTVTPTAITMASGTSIPIGGCTIVVTLTSSTPGKVTNVTGPLQTSAGPVSPASAPLTVTAAGVALGKTIAPATIVSGGAATLTLTLGNATANPLTLTAAFTDTMPAGVTTTSANTGTCTGVTVTPTLISMASGSTIALGGCTIVVTITSSTIGPVTNVTSPLQTSGGTAPAASAPLTVSAIGVTLGKTIAPATIVSGGTSTLTLTLGNATANPLTLTAAFTDTMPAGVTTTSANTGTCSGVTVTPMLISMASGASVPAGGCTIVVTITSSTPGTVTNVTGPLQTGAGTAPAASAPITVTATSADLAITKTNNQTSVTSGSVVTYAIVVTNNGPAVVTGAMVNDVVALSLTNVTWTCTASAGSSCPSSGNGNIAVSVDLLAAGTATFTLTGTLSASATGSLGNTATVTVPAGVTDPVPGNNSATDADPIVGTAIDLAIAKTNNSAFVPGQTGAKYTIIVSNVGAPADRGKR